MNGKIKVGAFDRIWKHICVGGEQCSQCRKIAEAGEFRLWVSSMDQDDLFCTDCAELS